MQATTINAVTGNNNKISFPIDIRQAITIIAVKIRPDQTRLNFTPANWLLPPQLCHPYIYQEFQENRYCKKQPVGHPSSRVHKIEEQAVIPNVVKEICFYVWMPRGHTYIHDAMSTLLLRKLPVKGNLFLCLCHILQQKIIHTLKSKLSCICRMQGCSS